MAEKENSYSFVSDNINIKSSLQINEDEMNQEIKHTKSYGKCLVDWDIMKEYIKYSFLNVIINYFGKNDTPEKENTKSGSNNSNIENEMETFDPAKAQEKSSHSIPENKLNFLSNFNTAPIPSKLYIKPEPNPEDIINSINKLKTFPFTLQRMCELLQDPMRYYKTKSNFISAFSKLANID